MTVNYPAHTAKPDASDDMAARLACVAAGDIPDDAVTGVPVTALSYQAAGEMFSEWAYVQLDRDATEPTVRVSFPPGAADGEVRLTASEALRLAGALRNCAHQARGDLAFADGKASPCCPGETLTSTGWPVVVCPECGSLYAAPR